MDSQIETISTVECRVRVTIPWIEVEPRFDGKFREIKRSARIPGFRPGKVPPQVIERLFGRSVRDDLTRDLVQETFQTAMTKHKAIPLTEPVVETARLERGEDFSYAARFEVAPKLEPKDYTGVPVRRRPTVVDATKVDALLEQKREALVELRPIPDDAARTMSQSGDTWTVDLEGTFGEQPLSRKDLKIEVGSPKEFIPGLEAAIGELPLAAVGTTRTVEFLPPQENLRPEFVGRKVTLQIGFREVREKYVPPFDDDFARDTGDAETFEELKAKLTGQVQEEDAAEAERDARRRLVASLLERNPFEAAPSMISREVAAQVDLTRRQLQQQGVSLAQVGLDDARLAERIRPQASFNVKAFLLLDAIGKAEGIDVAEDEVARELEELANERNTTVQRLRATMEKSGELLLLRAQIREAKILDFLMGKAEVTEAPDPDTTSETGGDAIG
jgi:trigger factor